MTIPDRQTAMVMDGPGAAPVIDWDNLDEVLRLMRSGAHVGKVALTIG